VIRKMLVLLVEHEIMNAPRVSEAVRPSAG
jgi:hypothetical protein